MFHINLTSILLWFGMCILIVAVLPAALPLERENLKSFVIGVCFNLFCISINLLNSFDVTKNNFQLIENYLVSPNYNLYFSVGIDGLNLSLLLLTSWVFFICIATIDPEIKKFKILIINILLIEFFIYSSFIVTDLFFFYIFFESTLIPMYLIVGIWGSRERKIKAAVYLFLYTLFGSFFLLFGMLYIYSYTHIQGNFSYEYLLKELFLTQEQQLWLWLCFFLPFAIKIPMMPFHIWLPEAHVEAPTSGSIILASLLLKLGGYGFLRFTLPLVPIANDIFSPLIFGMACISILYASLTTIRQTDLKRIIAYSSIAHMNLAVLGIFSYTHQGIDGAIYLMISHGITSGALFACIGVLYDRYHTRLLFYFSGLTQVMPCFSVIFLIFSLANAGFPGTANFVGEFLIFVGLFEKNTTVTFIAATGIVFSAVYSIWLYNRICFGTLKVDDIKYYTDLTSEEIFIFLNMLFFLIVFGIQSNLITILTNVSIKQILVLAETHRFYS